LGFVGAYESADFPVSATSCPVPQALAGAAHEAAPEPQSSFVETTTAAVDGLLSWSYVSSRVGFASTPVTPKSVNVGPKPRIRTCFDKIPPKINPPIATLSAVPTNARVEILSNRDTSPTLADADALSSPGLESPSFATADAVLVIIPATVVLTVSLISLVTPLEIVPTVHENVVVGAVQVIPGSGSIGDGGNVTPLGNVSLSVTPVAVPGPLFVI
jgi:hypothetical protein